VTVLTTSGPQQQVKMPSVDLRQFIGSLVAAEGTRTSTEFQVAQRAAGANMSVDISGGFCLIADDHAAGGGYYHLAEPSTTNLAVTAADPTNPRIDRVIVQAHDQFQGDADNVISLRVIAGTPTGGASLINLNGAAAVPSSSLLLANVLVPAAATSIVTSDIAQVGLPFHRGGRGLSGIVDSTGAIVSGAGFTASRTSAGIYVITFNVPFSAGPAVLVTATPTSNVVRVAIVGSFGIGSATIVIMTSAGVPTDCEFCFRADPSSL
jgi:hypothetical protein